MVIFIYCSDVFEKDIIENVLYKLEIFNCQFKFSWYKNPILHPMDHLEVLKKPTCPNNFCLKDNLLKGRIRNLTMKFLKQITKSWGNFWLKLTFPYKTPYNTFNWIIRNKIWAFPIKHLCIRSRLFGVFSNTDLITKVVLAGTFVVSTKSQTSRTINWK